LKTAIALAALGALANAPAVPSPRTSLSVYEVIALQATLIGKRVAVHGRLSDCRGLSCSLSGVDPKGNKRFLSIGPDLDFDAQVARLGGRKVEIEVTVTDECMPDIDPNIIPLCADRASTLIDPVLVRAL
jgi:hypothetical protein